ncbi:dimethylaniline monooxygenase [Wickerhamomyces ciferrii]|uniref:Dimethylaniline monooxygenase n=1 Tax=Wickerhamomyces ciferrii (strain ATCC 14091 / BCRC 22168 / CBS 111 / JCM 3599 / NBRC 0793 / NRRL Y-1031 F-60-10) TaxID=1206466 RepID=K0KFW4_WICCF|nr:dimethylaniline monooxygenase [Wickerhamomyces ciferrii]CCH44050.1 dimethylaniline monooxygenase [Wickerhamomyces ciferrii]
MTIKKIRSVGIIGGGPSGAISLDSLIKESTFDKIVLFERKDNFGGTWRADEPKQDIKVKPGSTPQEVDPPIPLPQEFENADEELKVEIAERVPRWDESPATYRSLRTNVPERIMTFSDDKKFPWLDQPNQDELTTRESVEKYIINYIERLSTNPSSNVEIFKNTHVERILKKGEQWEVVIRSEVGNLDIWKKLFFDSIIIATGHYNVPQIPNVEGINEFILSGRGQVLHSKGLIVNSKFQNKKVIVIGSRSSASDTVRELKTFTNDIIWSVKDTSTTFFAGHKLSRTPETLRKPPISKYVVQDDTTTVFFEDGSSAKNPDYVIYATGYFFSYPFLQDYNSNLTPQGKIIKGLYQHTFYIKDPSLSFVGTPIDGMSFRVFEIQAILVARYLAGKIKLPSVQEQEQWHKERLEKYGISRLFHTTGQDPALIYIDNLIKLGGGYDSINGTGKPFPKFSELDLEIYEANKKQLTERWSLT